MQSKDQLDIKSTFTVCNLSVKSFITPSNDPGPSLKKLMTAYFPLTSGFYKLKLSMIPAVSCNFALYLTFCWILNLRAETELPQADRRHKLDISAATVCLHRHTHRHTHTDRFGQEQRESIKKIQAGNEDIMLLKWNTALLNKEAEKLHGGGGFVKESGLTEQKAG